MFNNISKTKDQILNLHQFIPIWGKWLVVMPILIGILLIFIGLFLHIINRKAESKALESIRALNINPRIYLEDIMRRIMGHNSQKLHELLPDVWALSANR